MPSASSIPGPEFESAHQALHALTAGTTGAELRAAVAFVTSSGVDMVERLLGERDGLRIELVARGAPITEPSALVRLAELGAEVSVIVGDQAGRFHPKLWLLSRGGGDLDVLSGSGNLTAGGLIDNREQFEHLRFETDQRDAIERQAARFEYLREGAVPLADLRGTPYWSTWEAQTAARRELAERQRELDEELSAVGGSELAKERLYADLLDLYERTKAEVTIPDGAGGRKPYVASRFKQAIDMGREDGTIVTRVHGIVRKQTEGFGRLAEAEREDLMVESLVLDEEKPYHGLFSEATKERARSNRDAFLQRPRSEVDR